MGAVRIVIGVQADRYVEPVAVNESLGAASAEVLRFAARSLDAGSYSPVAVRVLKKVLAKTVMAGPQGRGTSARAAARVEGWAEGQD